FHGDNMPIGDIFKIKSDFEEGPYGPGSGEQLYAPAACPLAQFPQYTARFRYSLTYKLETNTYRVGTAMAPGVLDELIKIIEDFQFYRNNGKQPGHPASNDEIYKTNFHLPLSMKYYAVQNWGAAGDDW